MRKKYKEDLRASAEKMNEEHEKRKLLSKKLSDLLERERRAIGGALHDDVGQRLAIIKNDVQLTIKELEANRRDAAEAVLRNLEHKLKNARERIREISRQLRPDILDNLGLPAAVENLVHTTMKNRDINIELFIKDIPSELPPEKYLTIYRLVQDSLTYILKHSRAVNVYISIGCA